MTARFLLGGVEPYEIFRRVNHQAVRSAFLYADGALDDPEADEFVDQLRRAEATSDSDNRSGTALEFESVVALYQAIVDLNMAALIGHEVAHLFDDKCPLSTTSAAETSGLFDSTVTQQLGGQLFCPRFPVIEEVKADRCALRHIHGLHHHERSSAITDDSAFGDFVRRAAADMVAFQALTGWRRFTQLPPGRYILRPLDQYLYAPYRVLLMTAEIHGERPRPAVCGEAAGLFVHGVQESFRACPDGGGIVTDDLLALLPPKLEESWNGAPWTDESFACEAVE